MYKLIRYFYYFIYKGRLKSWKNQYIAELTSSILVTIFFSINVATLPILFFVLFNLWIYPKELSPEKNIWPLIGVISVLFMLYLTLNKFIYLKHSQIIKEFEKISSIKKRNKNIIIVIYMIATFVLYIAISLVASNKNNKKIEFEKEKLRLANPKQDSLNKARLDSFIKKADKKPY